MMRCEGVCDEVHSFLSDCALYIRGPITILEKKAGQWCSHEKVLLRKGVATVVQACRANSTP